MSSACQQNGGRSFAFSECRCEEYLDSFLVRFWKTSKFLLRQLDYSLSISMRDSRFVLRPRQLYKKNDTFSTPHCSSISAIHVLHLLALIRAKIDFPWISVIHIVHLLPLIRAKIDFPWISVIHILHLLALIRAKIDFPWVSVIHVLQSRTLDNSNLPLTRSNFRFLQVRHSLYIFTLNNSNHVSQYVTNQNKQCTAVQNI